MDKTVFVLVVGDLYVPSRALDIPREFKDILVLVTGNLCGKEAYDYLRSLCNNIVIARGEFDDLSKDYLTTETTHAGNFKVGLYHGHQSIPLADPEILSALGTQLGVDVLITGGTHKSSVSEHNGILLLNPGSTTGAYSAYAVFQVLEVTGSRASIFTYTLHEKGKTTCERTDYEKSK